MKKDIHPKQHHVIFRDASVKKDFYALAFLSAEELKTLEKDTVDGVEYYVIQLDVSSASHPFFTGKQKLVDTSGRVERFKRQMAKMGAA